MISNPALDLEIQKQFTELLSLLGDSVFAIGDTHDQILIEKCKKLCELDSQSLMKKFRLEILQAGQIIHTLEACQHDVQGEIAHHITEDHPRIEKLREVNRSLAALLSLVGIKYFNEIKNYQSLQLET